MIDDTTRIEMGRDAVVVGPFCDIETRMVVAVLDLGGGIYMMGPASAWVMSQRREKIREAERARNVWWRRALRWLRKRFNIKVVSMSLAIALSALTFVPRNDVYCRKVRTEYGSVRQTDLLIEPWIYGRRPIGAWCCDGRTLIAKGTSEKDVRFILREISRVLPQRICGGLV